MASIGCWQWQTVRSQGQGAGWKRTFIHSSLTRESDDIVINLPLGVITVYWHHAFVSALPFSPYIRNLNSRWPLRFFITQSIFCCVLHRSCTVALGLRSQPTSTGGFPWALLYIKSAWCFLLLRELCNKNDVIVHFRTSCIVDQKSPNVSSIKPPDKNYWGSTSPDHKLPYVHMPTVRWVLFPRFSIKNNSPN